jgi:hypothetical protein
LKSCPSFYPVEIRNDGSKSLEISSNDRHCG